MLVFDRSQVFQVCVFELNLEIDGGRYGVRLDLRLVNPCLRFLFCSLKSELMETEDRNLVYLCGFCDYVARMEIEGGRRNFVQRCEVLVIGVLKMILGDYEVFKIRHDQAFQILMDWCIAI
ncbi:hypothetical protein ACLOJK_040773 [Asimina triloba]